MFTAENEDVLVQFQSLCEQYPRENVVALWEMAGGKFDASQHGLERTLSKSSEAVPSAADEIEGLWDGQ